MNTMQPEPVIVMPARDEVGLPFAYEVAQLFPRQGDWTETDYWALPETNRIVELSNGRLIVPPMPTDLHQLIVGNIHAILRAFLRQHKIGRVRMAPLPIRLWEGKLCEPDVIVMLGSHLERIDADGQFWGVPDLVIEVLSPGTKNIDRDEKKREYAHAGIPEYWIVVPDTQTIEVYHLDNVTYAHSATYISADRAETSLLPGFVLDVAEVFSE